jgi:hypothetical protein
MENRTKYIHDPLNNDLPQIEDECGIVMNNNVWYLCRAEIPMSELENIEKANEYANLFVDMMYSPLDESLRQNHYSAFSFVMAMQGVDTFYLYFYKFKYFDTMAHHWGYHLNNCNPFRIADVVLWPKEYHNFEGVNTFDKARGYDCYAFYEDEPDMMRFFELLGVDRANLENRLTKKLKRKIR